jgi:HD-GYP domain-containing protein (c-di-GMP phosphodiesterase class II)
MMRGPDIPLEARIIGIANVYVALKADRSYRVGLSRGEALKVMEGAGGTELDPGLVRILRSLEARGGGRRERP